MRSSKSKTTPIPFGVVHLPPKLPEVLPENLLVCRIQFCATADDLTGLTLTAPQTHAAGLNDQRIPEKEKVTFVVRLPQGLLSIPFFASEVIKTGTSAKAVEP